MKIKPPVADKVQHELIAHNDTRVDNYYWMKLSDEQKNAEVLDDQTKKVVSYLEAENEYTKSVMKSTEDLQQKLFDEIIGRIKQTDESVPYKDNGYFYYNRYEEGKEYPIYCRKKDNLEAKEHEFLNVNTLAEGFSYYDVSYFFPSPDNKIMAYGDDTVSRRKYTIHFKYFESGELLQDKIPNTTGYCIWANDNKTVFYVKKDETLRPYKIFKHILGTDTKNDEEIFHEEDATFRVGVMKSKSNDYIFIGSFSTLSSEYHYINANKPESEFKVIQPRTKDLEYFVSHYKDKFYMRTNLDAKNFRLMETMVDKPGVDNWKELIPHREDVLLTGVEIFKDYLILSERKNGLAQINVKKWTDNSEYYIDFGEETYDAYLSQNLEFDSKILRYKYTSLTTPRSTYDIDLESRNKTLLKQQEVVGEFSPDNYQAERLYIDARDGVKVPVSIVYKKGIEKDGSNPLLLYAYGSYGSSMDPYFSYARLSLLDRGFVFAIAHVRGGQELGRQWYEDGKLLNKKNTFYDFIDCAEALVDKKYTCKEKLFAGSQYCTCES